MPRKYELKTYLPNINVKLLPNTQWESGDDAVLSQLQAETASSEQSRLHNEDFRKHSSVPFQIPVLRTNLVPGQNTIYKMIQEYEVGVPNPLEYIKGYRKC